MPTHPMRSGTYRVSSGYGPRWGSFHAGLDFAAPIGTPIYAAADGVVVEGRDRTGVAGFGSWIWIDCQASAGVDLIYGHVQHSSIRVTAGDRVRAGQQIGVVGNEGQSTGPHLHFEVWGPPGRSGGNHRDPARWLIGATDPPLRQEYDMTYYDVDWSPRFDFGRPRPLSGLIGVCIHTTESADGATAESVATYQLTSRSGPYHVLVDHTGKRLRENTDDWQTWSTGNRGNDVLVHLSFCARAAWSRQRWLSEERMLRAGASVVAHWCRTHGWPIRHVGVAGLPGITTHDQTRVWGGTDHTDPGPNFPWDVFLRYVREAGKTPVPPATTPTRKEPTMSDFWDQQVPSLVDATKSFPRREYLRFTDYHAAAANQQSRQALDELRLLREDMARLADIIEKKGS